MSVPLPVAAQSAALGQLNPRATESAAGRGVDEAMEAAREFESVFLSIMLDFMWKGPSTEPPFGGGYGEDIFHSMLNQEYANSMTRAGGIGIADTIYREIIKLQESTP